jgi:hypothetical protein
VNFFTYKLDELDNVVGRQYWASTRDPEPLGEIIGRRRSHHKNAWDLIVRKPNGQIVEVTTGALMIPIKEVELPTEPPPEPHEDISPDLARRMYRDALRDDIERQERGEAAVEGYALPPEQRGPRTPSEREPGPTFRWFSEDGEPPQETPEADSRERSIFPAATPAAPQPKEPSPADPAWTDYMLGKPPFIGPPPIKDPALIGGPTQGGNVMSSPLERIKARLGGIAAEMNAIRAVLFADSDGISQQTLKLSGMRSHIMDRITELGRRLDVLTQQKGYLITVTAGHQVASPTNALHRLDQAIEAGNQAIAALRGAIVAIDESRAKLARADDEVRHASTFAAGVVEEIDRYRTSF